MSDSFIVLHFQLHASAAGLPVHPSPVDILTVLHSKRRLVEADKVLI